MQNDPYDQFASGYVGMGNDPGNGTDPSGGFFGVGGSGCAAAAGMSGYGGLAGSLAFGNFLNVISTVSLIGATITNGMQLGNLISQNSEIGDPPTKNKPPLQESREWTERQLEKVTKKKPSPSPNPWLMLVYLLLWPSDANARIDDTPDGIGGWKKATRDAWEQERAEDAYEDANPNKRIRYVTYTKTRYNEDGTITVYSGRTSGSADETAEEIVRRRDAQHNKQFPNRLNGYGRAVVDREDVGGKGDPSAKWRIRGREQQLIDRWGRAQRDDNGTSGNIIRGVSKENKMGRIYHDLSSGLWGQLWYYTGN
jgi:hypothetical protein